MNPLSRLLASVLAVVVLAGALFFGVVVFLTALGLGLVAWAVLWLRIWWIRRRVGRSGESGPAGSQPPRSQQPPRTDGPGAVIEGEYTVVSDRDRKQDESSDL
jgi:hypothetical protein